MVNLDGKRFMNEFYMDNTTYTGNSLLQQKKNCGFSIIGSEILDYYKQNGLDYITYHHGIRTLDKWEHEKKLYLAGEQSDVENSVFASEDKDVSYSENVERNFWEFDSLEELCATTGINLENLKKTLDEYNDMAGGYDWQFCKPARYLKAVEGPQVLCGPSLPLRLRLSGRHQGQRKHGGAGHPARQDPRSVLLRHRLCHRVRRQLLLLQPRLHHVLRHQLRPYRGHRGGQVHEL